MAAGPPFGTAPGDRVVESVIPPNVDGGEVDVTVISTWQPEPSVLPLVVGAVAGSIAVLSGWIVARRGGPWALVALGPAVIAIVAGTGILVVVARGHVVAATGTECDPAATSHVVTTHSRSSIHSGNNGTRSIRARAVLVAAVLAIGIAACGSDDAPDDQASGAAMAEPWSRQPAEGQALSAVYGELTNTGSEPITAVAATADVAPRVELHETTMADDGQMAMNLKAGGYTIEPGDTLVFEPGGPHIMLFDVDAAAYPDTVPVTLEFSDGSSIDFTAEVREIGDGDMEMDEGGTDVDGGDENMQRNDGDTDGGEIDNDG